MPTATEFETDEKTRLALSDYDYYHIIKHEIFRVGAHSLLSSQRPDWTSSLRSRFTIIMYEIVRIFEKWALQRVTSSWNGAMVVVYRGFLEGDGSIIYNYRLHHNISKRQGWARSVCTAWRVQCTRCYDINGDDKSLPKSYVCTRYRSVGCISSRFVVYIEYNRTDTVKVSGWQRDCCLYTFLFRPERTSA